MSQKEIKRINVRFYFANKVDLVDRAINTSGVSQAEWSRRALIQAAENQIHGGRVEEILLRNLLLVRRLIMRMNKADQRALETDKAWAKDETEKLMTNLRVGGHNDEH